MSQTVHFQGNPVSVQGTIPQAGAKAQPFTLVAKDLSDVALSQYAGKRKVLNIFPSIDTGVCRKITMSQTVHFQGNPVSVQGTIPQAGAKAQPFTLVAKDLSDVALSQFAGSRKVLNIFPSIDTGVCAASVRKFNQLASELNNTVVLCISADLPFAQSRFCGAEGLNNVVTLSTLRGAQFLADYGVAISAGPLAGLAARAVVVIDENDQVIYSQLVNEITEEPDYDAALAALKA